MCRLEITYSRLRLTSGPEASDPLARSRRRVGRAGSPVAAGGLVRQICLAITCWRMFSLNAATRSAARQFAMSYRAGATQVFQNEQQLDRLLELIVMQDYPKSRRELFALGVH